MSLLAHLAPMALRPLLPALARMAAEASDFAGATVGIDVVEKYLASRFTDESREELEALARAAERAWKAVEIALAGPSLWDRLARRGEDKALAREISAFLDANPLELPPGQDQAFRNKALVELRAARKAGLIPGAKDPGAVREALLRFGDRLALCEAEWQASREAGKDLAKAGHRALAGVISVQVQQGQPPLLALAIRFFFRSEIKNNSGLFQGRLCDQVDALYDQIGAVRRDLAAGFEGLRKVVENDREQLDEALLAIVGQIGQIAEDVSDLKSGQRDLQEGVGRIVGGIERLEAGQQDLRREMALQSDQIQVLYRLLLAVGEKQDRLHERPLRPKDSLSIQNETVRRQAREAVNRFHALPEQQRRGLTALWSAVARVEFAAGDFDQAQLDFQQQAQVAGDRASRRAAHHGAYLAALEARRWDVALAELKQVVPLDEEKRFVPFPFDRYPPERILGAGGFGVAFLCREVGSRSQVVVKALRTDDLDHESATLLSEATNLADLDHERIIRLHRCAYADPARTRPYLVMDYFQGVTLEQYVQEQGVLSLIDALELAVQVAEGLRAAHEVGIFHRDIKPANILVRKTADRWTVKLIDFGLAVKAQSLRNSLERSGSRRKSVLAQSIAGTVDYASPEQMGKLPGNPPIGRYSDVWSFGKTCYYASLGTPEPDESEKEDLDPVWRRLLADCTARLPEKRLADFAGVLQRLSQITTAQQREGETKLRELLQKAFLRTQGKPTEADSVEAKDHCRRYHIPSKRGQAIVGQVREAWRQQQAALALRQKEGEKLLEQLTWDSLEQSEGRHAARAPDLCREFGISTERAEQIRQEVSQRWRKVQEEAESKRRAEQEQREGAAARQREEAEQRRREQEARTRREEEETQRERNRQSLHWPQLPPLPGKVAPAPKANREKALPEQISPATFGGLLEEIGNKLGERENPKALGAVMAMAVAAALFLSCVGVWWLLQGKGRHQVDVVDSRGMESEIANGPDRKRDVVSPPDSPEKDKPVNEAFIEGPHLDVEGENSLGIAFKRIAKGKFLMGSPEEDKDRGSDEKLHEVEITKDYYLGVHEVTQKQFDAVMGYTYTRPPFFSSNKKEAQKGFTIFLRYNPSYFSNDGKAGRRRELERAGYGPPSYFTEEDDYSDNSKPAGGKEKVKDLDTGDFPVENVSYEEAVKFTERLNNRDQRILNGWTYRLPTEAQWEYACRGKATPEKKYHFGDTISDSLANYNRILGRTRKVGSYKPNAWGLHDMHGNVAEWCLDWYHKDYYPADGTRDPAGPPGPGKAARRVVRGGGWDDTDHACRVASRGNSAPRFRGHNIGFRVALVWPDGPSTDKAPTGAKTEKPKKPRRPRPSNVR
jgi:formylglycine-generating enzyme required for sulfatase activity/serine/threonine protein kinase